MEKITGSALPYYKRYPRDLIEGSMGLSFELKGAYGIILDLIYIQQGALPDDPRYISGILGVSVRKWKSLRQGLIDAGKIQVNGEFLTNYRAIIELEKLAKLSDKQRKKRLGVRKNNGLPEPEINQPEPEPEPDTPLPPLKGDGDELDEDEKGKEKAAREAKKQRDRQEIIDALTSVVSDDVADNFFEHRREIKKPLTLRGAQLIIKKLEGNKLADQILNESIANGWQGVFPEKLQPRSQTGQPRSRIRKSYGLSAIGINEGGEE